MSAARGRRPTQAADYAPRGMRPRPDRVHRGDKPLGRPSTMTLTERQTVAAALDVTLLDFINLALLAKQAHWNVAGPMFRSLHLLLDELVELARNGGILDGVVQGLHDAIDVSSHDP